MHTKRVLMLCALLALFALQASAFRLTVAAPQVTVYPSHPRLIVGGYRGISVAQMQARCADPAFQNQCANIGDQSHVDDWAMDYMLHNDTTAAANVVAHLQNDSFNCSYERSNVGGYALAYDWVYNSISYQTTKNTIEDRLAVP
jgi:hypothetical protein